MLTMVAIFLSAMALLFGATFGMVVQEWHDTRLEKHAKRAAFFFPTAILFHLAALAVVS